MLSPALARWVTETSEDVEAVSAQRLGFVGEKDSEIIEAAREVGAAVLTKDRDFADEVERHGTPPVIWVRVGNTSTASMKRVLAERLPAALEALRGGAALVELVEE